MWHRAPTIITAFSLLCAGLTGCGVVERFTKASSDPNAESPSRVLSFIEAPSIDLGAVALGATRFFRVLISTTGNGDANLVSTVHSSGHFIFNGGTFPGTGGTCTQPIQGNCSLAIQFTAPSNPSDVGFYNDVITLTYQSQGVTRSTSITILATVVPGAYLTISGSSNFGAKNVGTSTDETLSILNIGALNATSITAGGLAAPLAFKGGSYPGTGGTCGNSLGPFASCTVVTNYSPITGGTTSKILTLNYESAATTESSTFGMTGSASALASLSIISPATNPFDFGSAVIGGAAVNQLITVKNNGDQTATTLSASGLAAPYSFAGGSYPGSGGNCGTTLTAGASCKVAVRFLPTILGVAPDTLDFSYSDGTLPRTLPLNLTGTGVSAAVLTVTPSPNFDYGVKTLGTTTAQTFTVTNSGAFSAKTISSAVLANPFRYKGSSYPGTGGSCGSILAAGVTCTLVVEFLPTSVGLFNQTIDLSYNDGVSAINTTRPISGTGGALATLTLSDGPTFDFGTVAKSYSRDRLFTVTHGGSGPATAISGEPLSAPFSYKGGSYPGIGGTCGSVLGVSGSCLVAVTFNPTTAAGSTGTLTLNYHDGSSATTSSRALAGNGASVSKIVGGAEHTCALLSNGIVRCWGSNYNGQLGDGNSATYSTSPVTVLGITTATDIATGSDHTCALLANQRVQCWGADASGQIGNNAALADVASPTFISSAFADFTRIAAGGNTSCARRSGGTVVCWGADGEGATGNNGSFVNNPVPVNVSALTDATDVSVGRGHACSVRATNAVRCWGANAFGQLGNNLQTNSGVSVLVSGSLLANLVSVGGDTSCAVLANGSVQCWGSGNYGQLANGNTTGFEKTPVAIPALNLFVKISMGLKHSCALDSSSAVNCWGRDNYGQLGNNNVNTDEPTPVLATGMTSVDSVGTGENHSCAVKSSGEVYCWGANASGQLGNTPLSPQPEPVNVLDL